MFSDTLLTWLLPRGKDEWVSLRTPWDETRNAACLTRLHLHLSVIREAGEPIQQNHLPQGVLKRLTLLFTPSLMPVDPIESTV